MKPWPMLLATLLSASAALAAPGEEVYRTHCGLCHDGGATQAPRLGQRADWTARIPKGRAALHESALKGVPDSAMMPKAGAPQLTDAEVIAAADYLLNSLGLSIKETSAKTEKPTAAPSQPVSRVDDATLTARVAEALRARLTPAARVDTGDGTRVAGIRIESSSGRVTLSGMVDDASVIRGAEETARATAGVTGVVNRLIGADLFEHD